MVYTEPIRITPGVLRNISRREYVRESTITAFTDEFGKRIGLGDVVLSRICWSSEPSESIQ
ncbi:hypothetical protein C8R44DRAFT_810264 [Mycena epipterygia]|nr:hypothetical protein C8R44DRAFT_810264 [Mycena epipterygia]